MKKIFFVIFGFMLAMISVSSCKYAPKEELGDTVAASVFDVFATQNKPAKPKKAQTAVKDSACIFVIGDGSDRHTLHLLSFPSRRDTFTYGKARHLKVEGNTEIGNIIRVKFFVLKSGDSIVSSIEQVSATGKDE